MKIFQWTHFVYILVLLFFSFVFVSPAQAAVDSDLDSVPDDVEKALGTDAANPDTDGDGYKDGQEIYSGYNPLVAGNDRSVKRWVEIDLSTQRFYYFMNGVKIGELLTSTGRPSAPTPVGEYKIARKIPVKTYRTVTGGSYPNAKWNLLFEPKRGLYIHTAYWHNDFGIQPRSGGCINLTLKDASRMYKFLDVGDKVKVYGKTPKGRLKLKTKK